MTPVERKVRHWTDWALPYGMMIVGFSILTIAWRPPYIDDVRWWVGLVGIFIWTNGHVWLAVREA